MADTRYLKQRRQGWYFQLAVPSELRAVMGKATITASLRTRDLTQAQERRWAKLIEAKDVFARVRGKKPSAAEPIDPKALLDIDDCARASYHEALAKMETDARRKVRAWDKTELVSSSLDIWDAIEVNNYAPVAEPLTTYCERHNVEEGSEHYARLGEALLLARLMAIKGRQKALEEGKPSDEPKSFLGYEPIDLMSLKPLRAVSRGGLVFAEVAHRFIAEKQRDPSYKLTEQTRGQYEAAFRLFDQWARTAQT